MYRVKTGMGTPICGRNWKSPYPCISQCLSAATASLMLNFPPTLSFSMIDPSLSDTTCTPMNLIYQCPCFHIILSPLFPASKLARNHVAKGSRRTAAKHLGLPWRVQKQETCEALYLDEIDKEGNKRGPKGR